MVKPPAYVLALLAAGNVSAQAAEYTVPDILVIGVTPLLGSGMDINKVPSNVQVVNPAQLRQQNPASVADMLDGRLGSVTISDYQGSPLQPNVSFRGFNASPVLGDPQGLAVFQNGMRLNEAFGDLVNWDMMPSFAVDTIQVLPGSNPAFGLNALGGALALRMKDGFTTKGSSVEVGAGSFGRYQTTAEYGRQLGDLAFYGGISARRDGGWRKNSPSQLAQSYVDVAARKDNLDVGLGVTLGASDLSGLGTVPLDQLSASRNSVFTSPDNTQNALIAVSMRGNYDWSSSLSVQTGAWYRHLRTQTHNGDAIDLEDCGGGNAGTLCDDDGNQILARGGGTIASTNTGAINNTSTTTDSFGLMAQLTRDSKLFSRRNTLVAGLSTEQGWTRFGTNSEIGVIGADRAVIGTGAYYGGNTYNVSLETRNAYYGAYVTDTLDITDRLHLTVSGRYNMAWIDLMDQLGSGLSGNHYYQRFNPASGLSWQITPNLTAFGGYAEANRTPTAAELACADPTSPCRVPNAFQSDPPLKQVVSRTLEVGLRGKAPLERSDAVSWSLALFGTRNYDDIIFVNSGNHSGQGYFTNAGTTQRQGIEASIDARLGRWSLGANYALVDATFLSNLQLPSPNNPTASNNAIRVSPGNRMPGIPQHSLKLEAAYAVTERWTVGADARLSSDRIYRGDESNTINHIPGYAVFNAQSSYAIHPGAVAFLRLQNILDEKYATAGTLGDADGGLANFPYKDYRFQAPGEPRSIWGGLRLSF